MVNYRRIKQKGGTYFFTATLQNRKSTALYDHINELKIAYKRTQEKYPFQTKAFVVLPEHIHAIWTLPGNDNDYRLRWRMIKTYFTKLLLVKGVKLNKNRRNEYALWQNRFWEHTIRDDHDLKNHINYIHYNPVKHHLVKSPNEWEYSSLEWFIKKRMLPKQWGENMDKINGEFGE